MVLSDCLWIWFGQIIIKKTMLYVCYHAVKSKGQTGRHNFRCMTVSKGKLPPSCVVFTSSGEHLTKPNQTSNGCKLIGEVGRTKASVRFGVIFAAGTEMHPQDSTICRFLTWAVRKAVSSDWLKPYSNQSSRTYINKKGKNVYKWHYRTLIKFNNKTEEKKSKELLF